MEEAKAAAQYRLLQLRQLPGNTDPRIEIQYRGILRKGVIDVDVRGVGERIRDGEHLPVGLHRIRYIIDKLGVAPATRAGQTRIFAPSDVKRIERELDRIDGRIDGLIVSNTTISRPPLRSPHAGEAGGLSGAPLHDLALARLSDFRRRLGARLPLIGAGGIGNADQAYARIRAGASLVQLYSALVYEGPYLPARINKGLAALLKRDGFASVGAAVGVDTD